MSIVLTRYGKMRIIEADNVVSGSLSLYGEWAEDELHLLGQIIPPGAVVLDVGAFIGTHSVAFSKFVGITGKVYSFEPRKEIYDILSENISINNCKNVTALNIGLAEKVQTLDTQPIDLETNSNFGGLSIRDNLPPLGSNKYQINLSTIDSIKVGKIDLIKLDVEGMEKSVLDGAIETIKRDRPIVFCECNSLSAGYESIEFCQDFQYDTFGFLASAYNPNNFNAVDKNIFGASKELALLLVPREKTATTLAGISGFQLMPIKNLEDLVLPMLNKSQYPYEVLLNTGPAQSLGICFPSPAIAKEELRNQRLQDVIKVLEADLAAHRSSKSWRITRPLRETSRILRRAVQLGRLLQKYKQEYPGLFGFFKLAYKCRYVVRLGGIRRLKNKIHILENGHALGSSQSNKQVLELTDATSKLDVSHRLDVAVHAHIYYTDLANEIRLYLENIPCDFSFYVTTDTEEKAKAIELVFSGMKHIKFYSVHITINRGRDIFPMLVEIGNKLTEHELVLHIHTKRSPHNSNALRGWRRYLMESLLGNPLRVSAILQEFIDDKELGILFPDPYYQVKPLVLKPSTANEPNMIKLLRLANLKESELENIDRTFFPAGDMLWFRGNAIKPLVQMGLSSDDFEKELGQVDATMAHAVERMFPYFAGKMGLTTKSFLSNSFLSQQYSAQKLDFFVNFITKGLVLNPVLLFDHNFGGGANTYSRELVSKYLSVGRVVLRIYHSDGVWFVQWVTEGDEMLFHTSSLEKLFKALSLSNCDSIILNSLYGYPDLNAAASMIVSFVKNKGATLDFKVHDFYSICPSPHLLDSEEAFCGVPQMTDVCKRCLKKQNGLYHSWYPQKNKADDITDWRKPFRELFEVASTITVFDGSCIDLLKKAFLLDSSKIKVLPHTVDYFKCEEPLEIKGSLHIGVMGTLTSVKGGAVVKKLAEHIEKHRLGIPVTVIGPSLVSVHKNVKVFGEYEQNDLINIILDNQVNVILMPSIVPETFSYTISEAMKMGLPIVVFDIGAQGNRVKSYALGRVIPLGSSSKMILEAASSALKAAQE